jgi:hypothetical protein
MNKAPLLNQERGFWWGCTRPVAISQKEEGTYSLS